MHITIVDDEKILTAKMRAKLQSAGFVVSIYHGYEDFMRRGNGESHLYIIDVSLGDGSGFEIVRWLRNTVKTQVPILIISGHSEENMIIHGLTYGGDDYMVKPLIPEVMIARVRALMRRPLTLLVGNTLKYKNIAYIPEKRETRVGETRVYLTHKESLMLELFLREQGKVINREELVSAVWGNHENVYVTDNTINATLSKMRKKVGTNLSLKTFYNEGYILE